MAGREAECSAADGSRESRSGEETEVTKTGAAAIWAGCDAADFAFRNGVIRLAELSSGTVKDRKSAAIQSP